MPQDFLTVAASRTLTARLAALEARHAPICGLVEGDRVCAGGQPCACMLEIRRVPQDVMTEWILGNGTPPASAAAWPGAWRLHAAICRAWPAIVREPTA